MANHPQNSPRGLWAKAKFIVGSSGTVALTGDSTGLVLSAGVKVSNKANAVLTGNSTGLVTSGQIRVANKRYLTANSTGFKVTGETALPTTDEDIAFTMGSNSTGKWFAINSTAGTWKYLNVTTKQPT